MNIPMIAIQKSGGLLPMLYKVREIAEELDLHERTLRDWLASGAPHIRDQRNHIWINGEEFSKWLRIKRKKRKSPQKLQNNEAWCFRCKGPVPLVDPKIRKVKAKLINISGNCPECGCRINRGGRSD